MIYEKLQNLTVISNSGTTGSAHRWFLKPPYGYVIGVLLWLINLSIFSVWSVFSLSYDSSVIITAGSLVFFAVFVTASVSSALVMGITAWNTPHERIRRQSGVLLVSLLLAVPFFCLFDRWPTLPYARELVGLVGDTIAHELFRLVFLGPAIGFAFVIFPLVVLGYRYALE